MFAFRNVSFLPEERMGIRRLNFELRAGKRLFLATEHAEQSKFLTWLLTERVAPAGGIYEKPADAFCQSDRWWLEGERVVETPAGDWLNLAEPYLFLGRRRSKFDFVDALQARSFLHSPVYRLRDEEAVRFALLSSLFQQSGLLVLSEVWKRPLDDACRRVLRRLVEDSPAALAVVDVAPSEFPCFDVAGFSRLSPADSD